MAADLEIYVLFLRSYYSEIDFRLPLDFQLEFYKLWPLWCNKISWTLQLDAIEVEFLRFGCNIFYQLYLQFEQLNLEFRLPFALHEYIAVLLDSYFDVSLDKDAADKAFLLQVGWIVGFH